ncbi:hypothetical protein BU15DRAFT_63574 [Melanogaster broomeanus]|nr:hypothetical protein BU15DRAFT_63574 [Melanogaster broomeanus]
MAYINPGNLMLHSSGPGSNQHYSRVANPPVHPGSMHAPMPRHYMLGDQRRIERVPRPPELSPNLESIPGITFSTNGWPGIRAKDLLKERLIIDSPYDTVLAHHRWRSTVVKLEWPGYDPKAFGDPMLARINVRPGERDITRQEIAREICGLLYHFHKYVSEKHPVAPGWEKWALTRGPEGIRIPDVVLLSIHYYRKFWVPEFYIIE